MQPNAQQHLIAEFENFTGNGRAASITVEGRFHVVVENMRNGYASWRARIVGTQGHLAFKSSTSAGAMVKAEAFFQRKLTDWRIGN